MPYRRIGKKVYKVMPDGKLKLKGTSKSERMAERHLKKLYMVENEGKKK